MPASTYSTATGARSSPGPAIRTNSCGRIHGTNTPSGIWGSPTVRATTPRPGTRLFTETSAGSIAWASSPVTTGQLSGGTKTSNSPPTTCCSTWTPGHLEAWPGNAQVCASVQPTVSDLSGTVTIFLAWTNSGPAGSPTPFVSVASTP